MFGRKKPEVLVVGAGPVGLFTALALTRRGVRVQVVDREWRTGTRSYALALHPEALRLIDELGLLPKVLEQAYHVRAVGIYRGTERKAEMRVSELAEDYSFVAVMRQDLIEKLLEEALAQQGVKVHWSHDVARLAPHDGGVTVTIDKLGKESLGYIVQHTEWVVTKSIDVEVPFVIGADGHYSRVRRSLDIDFPEIGGSQDFAVFEFKTDADLQHEMRLVLDEETANVCWPLPGGYCRWSFEIPRYDTDSDTRAKDRDFVPAESGPAITLTEEDLRRFLRERAPWFRGSVDLIRWRMLVRFERRLAESFGRGRMWLAGDAGHLTGPAGVQSMNVGMREGRDLAEAIAMSVQDKAPAPALDTYGAARLAEWRHLLGVDGGLEAGTDTDPWIAAAKARLLPCIPASGTALTRLASQLGLKG